MKSFDSFSDGFAYTDHIEREAGKGYLLETSVDEATKAEMITQVLSPEPPDGFYVEVGPATHPYVFGTSRKNIHYVAIDGGSSEYPYGTHDGWVEYRQSLTNDMASAITEMAARFVTEAPARSAQFMWGDAQQMPFPDRDRPKLTEEVRARALPVRETFMRNVLLAQSVHARSIEKILREQARVLSEDGLVIIRETNFDMYRRHFGEGLNSRYLSLLASLELTGFRRRVVLFDTDSAFHKLTKQYPGGYDNEAIYPSGYYLLCQQGEEGVITPERVSWWQNVARLVGGLASKH